MITMSWKDTLKSEKWGEETDLQGRVKDFKFELPESLLTEEEKKRKSGKRGLQNGWRKPTSSRRFNG